MTYPHELLAQNEANNWYFPNRRAMTFEREGPRSIINKNMTNIEGASSISSITGKLLFYTDGQSIWGRDQRWIEGGFGLAGGESSTTAALIVRRPGSDEYFVFTTGDISETPLKMSYSCVIENAVRNAFNVTTKNTILLEQSTERIAATQHSNGEDVWVIGVDYANSRICSWLLSDMGLVSDPVISDAAFENSGDIADKIGYMKFSRNGEYMAICLLESSEVCVYQFDNASGIAYLLYKLNMRNGAMPYGLEFSLNSDMLYVTCSSRTTADESYLIQYDLSRGDTGMIEENSIIIATPSRGIMYLCGDYYGALQLGPDGKIYHALARDSAIGVINHPDRLGDSCEYSLIMLPVIETAPGMSFNSYSLPAFNQSIFNPRRFVHNDVCAGDPMTFMMSDLLEADSTRWLFNDSMLPENSDTGRVIEHVFPSPGQYWVSACAYVGQKIDTITQRVRIYPMPVVSAMKDTAICHSSSVQLTCEVSNAREPLQYYWYPEAGLDDPYVASPLAITDSATAYHVIVSDLTGCVSEDSVFVDVFTELLMEGPRIVEICDGETAEIGFVAHGGIQPYQFRWNSEFMADTITSGLLVTPSSDAVYHCTVTDAAGCQLEDSIRIHVLHHAVIEVPDLYTICRGSSVIIEASIVGGNNNESLSWSPKHGLSDSTILRPMASPDTSTLYSMTITSDNGCVIKKDVYVQVVHLENPHIYGDTVLCEGRIGNLIAKDGYRSYLWSTGETSSSIVIIRGGEYALTVIDSNGCQSGAAINVLYFPRPNIKINGPDSIRPGEVINLSVDPDFIDYLWSTGDKDASIQVTQAGKYQVSVTDASGCIWSAERSITLAPRPMTVLSLPVLIASPGDTVIIAVRLIASQHLESFPRINYAGRLTFEKSILFPLGTMYTDIGPTRQVEFTGEYMTGEANIVSIPSIVTLGLVSESEITLEEFQWSPPFIGYTTNIGSIKVNICRDGGERLFDGEKSFALSLNYPNPFNSYTRIGFSLIERGHTSLYVMDMLGRRIQTLVDEYMDAGQYEYDFNAALLPSGQYYYMLMTPTQSIVKIMTLMK